MLFLSSYSPLFVILAIFYYVDNQTLWTGITLLLAGAGNVSLLIYLIQVNKLSPTPVDIAEIRKHGATIANYMIGYLIPFMGIVFDGAQEAAAYIISLAVLGTLYVNSNLIYLNPVLSLMGYNLYEVTLKEGGNHFLITPRRVVRRERLRCVKGGEDLLLEKRESGHY